MCTYQYLAMDTHHVWYFFSWLYVDLVVNKLFYWCDVLIIFVVYIQFIGIVLVLNVIDIVMDSRFYVV